MDGGRELSRRPSGSLSRGRKEGARVSRNHKRSFTRLTMDRQTDGLSLARSLARSIKTFSGMTEKYA